jgi:sec-independent protein translocase protein TatA
MGEFSLMHWIVVLAIFLLIFGPSKLPGLGQSLGKAIRGFKDGLKSTEDELSKEDVIIVQGPQNQNKTSQQTGQTEDKNRS